MPRRRRQPRKKRRSSKLLSALLRLRKLPPSEQQRQLQLANSKFILDLCTAARKARFVNAKPAIRKKVRHHRKTIRKFLNRRTSVHKKKQLLTQRGGIAPFLIPLIVAAIGGASSVGAAATHAAVSRA